MSKKLHISLIDDSLEGGLSLRPEDYPNIYVDHEVSEEEYQEAINTIITYFMQTHMVATNILLELRNRKMAPVKEMTLEEIEEQLGHKVKVVNQKEDII